MVFICPPRKGRGRPRGPNWRKDYKCPTCGKVFAQKGNQSLEELFYSFVFLVLVNRYESHPINRENFLIM